jgi:hypothetical protein
MLYESLPRVAGYGVVAESTEAVEAVWMRLSQGLHFTAGEREMYGSGFSDFISSGRFDRFLERLT